MQTYGSTPPTAQKTYYIPGDTVSFRLAVTPGRALQKASVRISGRLTVYNLVGATPTILGNGDDAGFDPTVGVDGAFSYFLTSRDGSNLESIMQYPRYVKIRRETGISAADFATRSDLAAGLCASTPRDTWQLCYGEAGEADSSLGVAGIKCSSFMFAPSIVLNNTTDNMPSAVYELTFGLADAVQFLCKGSGEASAALPAGLTYCLEGLLLQWIEVPEEGDPARRVPALVVESQRKTLVSNTFSIALARPAGNRMLACLGALSFSQLPATYNGPFASGANYLANISQDDLVSCILSVNGSAQSITYEIRSNEEVQQHARTALNALINWGRATGGGTPAAQAANIPLQANAIKLADTTLFAAGIVPLGAFGGGVGGGTFGAALESTMATDARILQIELAYNFGGEGARTPTGAAFDLSSQLGVFVFIVSESQV